MIDREQTFLDYYNEHCDYKITRENIEECKREFDRSLQTCFSWIDGKTDTFKFHCENERNEDDRVEYMIIKVKDFNNNILFKSKEQIEYGSFLEFGTPEIRI